MRNFVLILLFSVYSTWIFQHAALASITETEVVTDPIVIATENVTAPRNVIFSLAPSVEANRITRTFKRNEAGLQLKWELIQITDLEDVRVMLNDPSIRNVIIIAHASTQGLLLDSYSNQYPAAFFNLVSPSLQSLAIFSSYGEEVRQIYELDRRLDTASLARQRLIFTETGSKFRVQGFPHFLRVVDREIALKLPTHIPSPQKYYWGCRLDLSGVKVLSGDYGIFLGSAFISVIRSSEPVPSEVEFDCGLLTNNQPRLMISNLRVNNSSNLSLDHPAIRFHTLMSDHGFVLTTDLRRDNSVQAVSGQLD